MSDFAVARSDVAVVESNYYKVTILAFSSSRVFLIAIISLFIGVKLTIPSPLPLPPLPILATDNYKASISVSAVLTFVSRPVTLASLKLT